MTPEAVDPRSYEQSQLRRAPARVRLLALCALGACLVCALIEGAYVLAGRHPRGFGLGQVLALRLPVAALALLWLRVARRVRAQSLATPTFVATALAAAVLDAGFYVQGFARGAQHALLLVFSAVIGMQLMPLQRTGRRAYLAVVTAAHLALAALLSDGFDPLAALSFEAMALAATLTLAFILETHFRSHRRQFELREQMSQALAALEAGRTELLTAGSTLSSSSEELTGAARALWQQAGGLHTEVENIATTSARIALGAGDLSARASASARRAQEAHRRTGDIDQLVQALSASMAEVVRAVERSEANVRELQAHSSSVQAFVDLLRDIAEQTQMLGVNANLEAARAGEQGRGFAVVANEVRRLASETNRRTGEVSALMARMSLTMQEALTAALTIGETTQRFEPVLESARRTLSDIRTLVAQQQEDMGASNEGAGRQADDTAGISQACARLRGLVEAHANTTANVAATVAELADLSAHLRERAPRT